MGLLWRVLKSAVSGFIANDALSRGASIAFYAATSLAPVLLIVVAIAGLAFGQDAARGAISEELGRLLGPTGGDFINSILARSSDLYVTADGTPQYWAEKALMQLRPAFPRSEQRCLSGDISPFIVGIGI